MCFNVSIISFRVPVYSRNWHDIVFRLVEVGVALWFPCCLWNSMAPEQLWILNPRKLLRRQIDPVPSTSTEKVRKIPFPSTSIPHFEYRNYLSTASNITRRRAIISFRQRLLDLLRFGESGTVDTTMHVYGRRVQRTPRMSTAMAGRKL